MEGEAGPGVFSRENTTWNQIKKPAFAGFFICKTEGFEPIKKAESFWGMRRINNESGKGFLPLMHRGN
jgi:hypothetical protein